MKNKIEDCIKEFCLEFLESPYLCYTEHGLHARFYHKLLEKLGEANTIVDFQGKKLCIVQKEYPTSTSLGKSRRQNWDISIINKDNIKKGKQYDDLMLDAVVEFGLNASEKHLEGDIGRLTHKDANLINPFIVHLCRISKNFSKRDIGNNNKKNLSIGAIKKIYDKAAENKESNLVIYFGKTDEIWRIDKKGEQEISQK
jgi:hypothetical protein